ncbi:YceH family protein [Nevskia ramosa]|uniref:YceH family protein n=1 Tax=Nevskia ramosa TaxID=64002 RepID=UPI002355C4CB|nr:YceH family protein [Nevskia ramosa]
MSQILLSPNEARVLAALVEKSITTPQYYPMTVNALMMASNQKNSRSPVMNLTEGDTGAALNTLEADKLVTRDDNAGRVPKWRHRFHHQLLLKAPTMAVLATLMLRGPQTPAELRANAAVLNGPPDAEGIQAALNDLADRASPFVMQLGKQPGQAAARWIHLLSGTPSAAEINEAVSRPMRAPAPEPASSRSDLEARLAQLEARIDELEQRLTAAGG